MAKSIRSDSYMLLAHEKTQQFIILILFCTDGLLTIKQNISHLWNLAFFDIINISNHILFAWDGGTVNQAGIWMLLDTNQTINMSAFSLVKLS